MTYLIFERNNHMTTRFTKIISIIAAFAMIFTALCFTSCGDESDTFTVGICQLVQHEALDAATEGFKAALKEKLGDKVTFTEQNASGDSATCVTICNQFVTSGVDLIMANATAALQAASAATSKIPVIATSITDYSSALDIDNWTGATGKNISGTCDLAPLDTQAEMIKQLFPDANKVGILYCSAEANSKYQVETITPLLAALGYTVKSFTFADTNDVSSVTASACDECDVIYIPTDNTAASCAGAIGSVCDSKNVPVFAGEEGLCRYCGAATLTIKYYDIGYEAGLMAYEILVNGADVSTMDIRFAPVFTKKYNKAYCDKYGITVPSDWTELDA